MFHQLLQKYLRTRRVENNIFTPWRVLSEQLSILSEARIYQKTSTKHVYLTLMYPTQISCSVWHSIWNLTASFHTPLDLSVITSEDKTISLPMEWDSS